MAKSTAKRELVGYLGSDFHFSLRRACRLAGISRKAVAYGPVDRGDQALISRLKQLGEQYPRYGYLMLHALLKHEGLVVNRKRTYRLYTELGMQVRIRGRKKLFRPRVSTAVPKKDIEPWSLDFVHDQLSCVRRIRILNIVDDYSRSCVGQLVDTSNSERRMIRYLNEFQESCQG